VSRFAQDISTGLTGNGAVNIVTRSGGNQLHGSGLFYWRDDKLGLRALLRIEFRSAASTSLSLPAGRSAATASSGLPTMIASPRTSESPPSRPLSRSSPELAGALP
jgi:hypothetical protein